MRDIIKLLSGKSEAEKKKILESLTEEEAAAFLDELESDPENVLKRSERLTFKRILDAIQDLVTGNQTEVDRLDQLGSKTPQEVKEIAEPSWLPKILKNLTTGLVAALNGLSVRVGNEDKEPIPVRLLDKDGKPADFKPTVNFSGNSGSLLVVEKLSEIDAKQDPLSAYQVSDKDLGGETEYLGYVDKDGNWFIQQMTTTAHRFIKGTSDYTTSWTGRAGLTYDYFYNVF
jgi:hypothetical protein